MREGGELSLFVDSCFELSDDVNLAGRIRSDRAYQIALKEREGVKTIMYSVPQVSAPEPSAAAPQTAEKPKQAPSISYSGSGEHLVRIHFDGKPASKGFERLLNFLAYFHGNMPVEVLFESDKSIVRLDDVCKIQADEMIIKKLAELVGDQNIEIF